MKVKHNVKTVVKQCEAGGCDELAVLSTQQLGHLRSLGFKVRCVKCVATHQLKVVKTGKRLT